MDVNTCIRQIEEEIALCRSRIDSELHTIALKGRDRNSLCPISKILPEVLADIFILFAQDPISWFTEPHESVGPYSWIVVAHVCHSWREAALSTPRLWSYIYLGMPERIKVFIERSRQAPLTILPWVSRSNGYPRNQAISSLPASARAASLRLVLAQSYRIQSLHVELQERIVERVFGPFKECGFYAPILKEIRFRLSSPIHSSIFPDILLQDDLPRLTYVELQGYSDPWRFLLPRSNLTTLILRNAYKVSVPNCTEQLLTCLSHMPQLRTLEVCTERCTGQCESGHKSTGSIPPVNLPYLEVLILQLGSALVDRLVSHCQYPTSTQVSLNTILHHDHPRQIQSDSETCSIMLNCLYRSNRNDGFEIDPPITGVSIVFQSFSSWNQHENLWGNTTPPIPPTNYISQITLRIYRRTIRFGDKARSYTIQSFPPSHFSFSLRDRVCDAVALLHTVLLQLPLSSLEYLDLDGKHCDFEVCRSSLGILLVELIRRCPEERLDFLRLSGSGTTFLPYLITSFHESKSSGPEHCFFNHLHTLMITDMFVGNNGWGWAGNGWDDTQVPELCTTIRSQARHYRWGCGPFSTLILESITTSCEWVEELIESFSELFDQEGRFLNYHQSIHPESTPPVEWMAPVFFEEQTNPNPDSDLDFPLEVGWGTPSPPFTPPLPLYHRHDWVLGVCTGRGRALFDFKGNSGMRFLGPGEDN